MADGGLEALRAAKFDRYTQYGAGITARQVQKYWNDRGYDAVRAEAYPLEGFDGLYGVRSNLVNGLPLVQAPSIVPEAVPSRVPETLGAWRL